jgi:hypothetical protein
MAEGAVLMTDTTVGSRVLGSAWPIHMNRPLAEAMYANITDVGLPEWSEADVTLATAVQRELGVPETLLSERPDEGRDVHAAHPPRRHAAVWLNEEVMTKYRPELRKYYYDPTRYESYLEQLGIEYPTTR